MYSTVKKYTLYPLHVVSRRNLEMIILSKYHFIIIIIIIILFYFILKFEIYAEKSFKYFNLFLSMYSREDKQLLLFTRDILLKSNSNLINSSEWFSEA